MKKLFATIALGLVISGAMAQDSTMMKRRPGSMHRQHDSFADLQLTADQKSQLAQLRKEQQEKMMAILTPEQKAKLAKQKAARKAAFADGQAKRSEHLKKALKLTDEQADKMKSLNDSFRQQASVIRANKELAAEQQRAQLKKLAADHRSEINAMLTPAQQDTLRQIRQRQHPKKTVR